LRRGHPGAALLLFDRHADLVASWLQRILGDEPALASVVAVVFRRVLRGRAKIGVPAEVGLGGGPGGNSLGAAVMRATTTEAARILRRRLWRRRLGAPGRLLFSPWASGGGRRDDPSGGAEETFYRALDRLSPEQRLAFCLATMGDFSDRQIADTCGWSLAKTRARLQSAISVASDLLEPQCLDNRMTSA